MAVEYDLVVIGGGSGGLLVAVAASPKVALIERDRLVVIVFGMAASPTPYPCLPHGLPD